MSLASFIVDQMRESKKSDALSRLQNIGSMPPDEQISALAQISPEAAVRLMLGRMEAEQEGEKLKKAQGIIQSAFGIQQPEAQNGTAGDTNPSQPAPQSLPSQQQGQTALQRYGALAAAGLMSPKDAIELARGEGKTEGAKPQSSLAKLYADRNSGLIDDDTFKAAVKKETERPPRQYNQFQQTSAGFAERMVGAKNLVEGLEAKDVKPVNETASVLSKVPLAGDYLQNITRSPEQQNYWNAAQEWIRAKLRKESGAVIGAREMEDEFRTYFPMPGDGPGVIQQKKQLRDTATDTMIKQSSGAYEELFGGEPQEQQNTVKTKTGKRIRFEDLK